MSEKPKKAEVINLAEYRERRAAGEPAPEKTPGDIITYFDGKAPTLAEAVGLAKKILKMLERVPLHEDIFDSQRKFVHGYSTDDLRNILGAYDQRLHFYQNEFIHAIADELLSRIAPDAEGKH